ncbi:MAG: hypothetical protein IJ545_00540 [Alphaproteobacteria bacterium]|nr:hypothetical protein [Alphaproteobacteria bacterium]
MNKTGFKTFVFSFVLTLSVILYAGRAYLYTPETTKEQIVIPRKNIALFFSRPQSQVVSSKVEPVQRTALNPPKIKREKLKIVQNLPKAPLKEQTASETKKLPETDIIPLEIEKKNIPSSPGSKKDIPDVPLIYAGNEKILQPMGNAQQKVAENVEPMQVASAAEITEPEPMMQPIVIKGTRQIIKIDNVKKRQERLKKELKAQENVFPDEEKQFVYEAEDSTVLSHKTDAPEENQIANLGEELPLNVAENQLINDNDDEKREWQTMAEKHQDENPWMVARGSKFVKNKQILEEEFSSESAKQKAEILIPEEKTTASAKVAVQDNLLIPIPQELLDEDDLVPNIDEDGTKKQSPVFKKKKDKSFFDNITSVFSKENREKAIKKLKEKRAKLVGSEGEDSIRPQILPTEIRLSFQPNRAEISGTTLKWIQAFARKASEESDVGLEIRIDGSHSFELQQKRLNLLYNILTMNDVPYQKINTMFVEREPNSFVVRTVKILSEKDKKKEDDSWKKYYQKW